MKNKPLEKNLTTEREVAQFIIDRYFKVFDGEIESYRKQLNNIENGKLPKDFTDPKNQFYKKEYATMSLNDKKLAALNDLEVSLDLFRNNERETELVILRYCGLMTGGEFDKKVLNPILDRDKIILDIFEDIHNLRCHLGMSEKYWDLH